MGVEGDQGPVAPIPQEGQPTGVLDHAVELVAVGDQIALAVGRLVDRVAGDDHSAEVDAAEVAHHLVVVAGHIDHLHALAGQAQDLLDDVVVRLRPVPARAQLPPVDDIAH
jgi:hypothetical protein